MRLDLSREEVELILTTLGEHEVRRAARGLAIGHVAALTAKIEREAAAQGDALGREAPRVPFKKTRLFRQRERPTSGEPKGKRPGKGEGK